MASSAFTQKCHFKRTVSAEAFFLLNTGSYNTVLHWASEMSELSSQHQLETLRLAAWVSWRPPVWTSMEISLYQPPTLISSLQNGKMSTQHPPHHGDVDRTVSHAHVLLLYVYCSPPHPISPQEPCRTTTCHSLLSNTSVQSKLYTSAWAERGREASGSRAVLN